MNNILICIPCYQGLCHVETMKNVIDLTHILTENVIKYELIMLENESLISRGRNICATYLLLHQKFSHLFFIDSDIVFNPLDVLHILNLNKDIISATYPSKHLNIELLKDNIVKGITEDLLHKSTKKIGIFDPDCEEKEVKRMLFVPTGFLMIKRRVFEKLSKSKSLEYINDVPNYNKYTNNKIAYNFFQTGVINNKLLSEDYGFSLLCRNSGFEIYCDVTIDLKHIGHFKY